MKALPRLDEDSRIVPILDNLSQGFLAGVSSEWSTGNAESNGEQLTADMIDGIAKAHYLLWHLLCLLTQLTLTLLPNLLQPTPN